MSLPCIYSLSSSPYKIQSPWESRKSLLQPIACLLPLMYTFWHTLFCHHPELEILLLLAISSPSCSLLHVANSFQHSSTFCWPVTTSWKCVPCLPPQLRLVSPVSLCLLTIQTLILSLTITTLGGKSHFMFFSYI